MPCTDTHIHTVDRQPAYVYKQKTSHAFALSSPHLICPDLTDTPRHATPCHVDSHPHTDRQTDAFGRPVFLFCLPAWPPGSFPSLRVCVHRSVSCMHDNGMEWNE
mmetsp:Transcript_34107/g.98230  ORF Transcript_34107/g.98230 Transcript_34107/m.98230 type:complete len:105 (+) Transcript_34107:975-1289(+)